MQDWIPYTSLVGFNYNVLGGQLANIIPWNALNGQKFTPAYSHIKDIYTNLVICLSSSLKKWAWKIIIHILVDIISFGHVGFHVNFSSMAVCLGREHKVA
jgi:hypothetical protein